jgi:HD-like signal output (HDOD) protein
MAEDRAATALTLQQCLTAVERLGREVALLREQLQAMQRAVAAAPSGSSSPRADMPVGLPGSASPGRTMPPPMNAPGPGGIAPGAPAAALRSSRSVWPGAGGSGPAAAPGSPPAEGPGYQPIAPRPGFLQRTPATLEQWLRPFQVQDLPVLAHTAEALERWRADEETVDLQALGEVIRNDPLMTLKVFAHTATARGLHAGSVPEDVTGALVMLGVAPFFRAFGPQRTVEQVLAGWPEALAGFSSVMTRSQRAARFALAFAVQRMDHDAVLIHSAALLHDFAELLVWFTAPHLALEMRRRQRARPGLRSAEVQMLLLNVHLVDLQRALSHHWHLPARLLAITDAYRNPNSLQVRTVQLAVRIARHSALGWGDPAIPDDVTEISRLLNLGVEPTTKLLRSIDEG